MRLPSVSSSKTQASERVLNLFLFLLNFLPRGPDDRTGVHSVSSIPAHPFGGLVLQVFFGQIGLVEAGIWLLAQILGGLPCWYIFWAGKGEELS